MKEKNQTKKRTKSILGYKLTLEIGKRFLAVRPMARRDLTRFPVRIVHADAPFGHPVASVGEMAYDKANRFLAAFNNGQISFEGRVWQ